jgi:hypothetical protein
MKNILPHLNIDNFCSFFPRGNRRLSKKSLNVQKWKNMLVLLKDLGYALDFFSTPSKHEYFLLIFLFLHYITSQHLFLNVYIIDAYFKLKDVIKVLVMKQANALLLMESLNDTKQAANFKEILLDVGVSYLDSEQTLKILSRRVDMK